MKDKKKKFIACLLILSLALPTVAPAGYASVSEAADAVWTAQGHASVSDGICTLTEADYQQSGALSRDIPLDTRNGFTLSFEYYIGNSSGKPREGFQLIFANKPVVTSVSAYAHMGYWDYIVSEGTCYYGIEFDTYSQGQDPGGQHIAAVKGSNSDSFSTHLGYTKTIVSDGEWHPAKVQYDGKGNVEVFRHNVSVLKCSNFNVPDCAYVGFSAGTSLYAFGCQKHMVRNIKVDGVEASRITLNANGGKCSTSSMYVIPNGSGSLPNATRTGYTFLGWYTEESGGTKVANRNYPFEDGQTLYAHWKINKYAVTFNGNGGSVSKKTKSVTYKKKVGSLPTAKRKGYTFLGWYTKKSGGKKISSSRVITGKTTFYAHWKAKKYTVTFNPNGGTLSKKKKSVSYKHKVGSLPTPKRKGYTFTGWYTKKKGGKKISTSRVITGKATFYAHWKKGSSGSGGSSGSSSSGSSSDRTHYRKDCPMCHGSGKCQRCGGTGWLWSRATDDYTLNCYSCGTTGKCFHCGGTGKINGRIYN